MKTPAIVSPKALFLLTSVFLGITSASAQLISYESFTYDAGNLIDQGSWIDASGTGSGPTVVNAGLSYSGLQTSGGMAASFGGGSARNTMMVLPDGGFGVWDGESPQTVYFSYLLQLSSIASTTPFQLTALDQRGVSPIGSRGGEVVVRDNGSGTGFYIGLMRGGQNGNNNAANRAGIKWIGGDDGSGGVNESTTLFAYDTTVFVVGAYNFLGLTKEEQTNNGGDDTADLWVNPSASSFGSTAPGGNVTAGALAGFAFDLDRVLSFDLMEIDGHTPPANNSVTGMIDDLRIGFTWADVTPAVPEPSSFALGALGLLALCGRRMVRR